MNCQRIQTLISSYIDQELTAEEKREVRRHLVTCAECHTEYQSLLNLKSQLENILPEPFKGDMIVNLRLRLADEERYGISTAQGLLWFRRLGLVATCTLTFLLSSQLLFPANRGTNLAQQNGPTLNLTTYSAVEPQTKSAPSTPVSVYDQNLSIDQSFTIYQASSLLP